MSTLAACAFVSLDNHIKIFSSLPPHELSETILQVSAKIIGSNKTLNKTNNATPFFIFY